MQTAPGLLRYTESTEWRDVRPKDRGQVVVIDGSTRQSRLDSSLHVQTFYGYKESPEPTSLTKPIKNSSKAPSPTKVKPKEQL